MIAPAECDRRAAGAIRSGSTAEFGREQQRRVAEVRYCFLEPPSAAPLPHRLRKQYRDGAGPRSSRADSRGVGAIQQSTVRAGTLESRPKTTASRPPNTLPGGRPSRAQSRDALAGGGVQQRGDYHLGPVAPARHRPRRKQHVRLRARTADGRPGPQRATESLLDPTRERNGEFVLRATTRRQEPVQSGTPFRDHAE
jgi:hypothetical protein